MMMYTYFDLIKTQVGKKVHVKLKGRDYAIRIAAVVGDVVIFENANSHGIERHYVHYTQVEFFLSEPVASRAEAEAGRLNALRRKK